MNSIVNDKKLFTSSIPSSQGNSRVALIAFEVWHIIILQTPLLLI